MKTTILHALAGLATKPMPSSIALSKSLGVSQQTASRWLLQLAKEGFIEKKAGAYRVTAKGEEYLSTLTPKNDIQLEGSVFTGLHEGRYYLSREGYLSQFRPLIGFQPYSGTLNLRLQNEEAIRVNRRLRARSGLYVKGFTEKERSFGGAWCYPALIQGKIKGAVIVPERTHYPEDVVELLAPVYLRRRLRLKDGSVVKVKILKKE